MSEAIIVALISSMAPVVAVIVGGIINWLILKKIEKTTGETRSIVNGHRTAMLALVSELRDRIAGDNPRDSHAQAAAHLASDDVSRDHASLAPRDLPEA